MGTSSKAASWRSAWRRRNEPPTLRLARPCPLRAARAHQGLSPDAVPGKPGSRSDVGRLRPPSPGVAVPDRGTPDADLADGGALPEGLLGVRTRRRART